MKRIFTSYTILCSLLFTGSIAHAQEFPITVDKYYSPYMGANLFRSGLSIFSSVDDEYLPDFSGEYCFSAKLARSSKTMLESFLSNWAKVAQHEYFGHGARAREFGMYNVAYEINFFHGATYYAPGTFAALNVNQQAALSAGGMEATTVLARELELDILDTDDLDYRTGILYLFNSLDQTMYVFGATPQTFHADSNNDIGSYITEVNQWLGYQDTQLDLRGLRHKMLWDLADPMLYLSLYAWWQYIYCGETTLGYSRLFIGEMSMMPTTRTLLAPYGPEFQLLLHLYNADDKYIGVYLRTGHTGGKTSYGADLYVLPLAKGNKWQIGNKLSVWHQPHLLKPVPGKNDPDKYGFGDFLTFSYQFTKEISTIAECGYKTSGYLVGTPLSRNLIWRIGFNIDCSGRKKGC